MTPTEADLRAALRRGTSGAPDPDRVLAAAQQVRRQRRTRTLAVTGSVASVLAVAGIVLGESVGHSGPTASTAPLTTSAIASPDQVPTALPAACPATPPQLAAPGFRPGADSGLPTPAGQVPGRDGQLLPTGVTAVRICVYSAAAVPAGQRLVTGPDAVAVATQLDALPAIGNDLCQQDDGPTVVLEATTATGPTRAVVGDAGGCGRVTNGSVTRPGRELVRTLAGSVTPGQSASQPPAAHDGPPS